MLVEIIGDDEDKRAGRSLKQRASGRALGGKPKKRKEGKKENLWKGSSGGSGSVLKEENREALKKRKKNEKKKMGETEEVGEKKELPSGSSEEKE